MTTLAHAFAPFLLNVTIKATLVLCLVAIIACLSRRCSTASRHFVWALGLSIVLCLPLFALVLPSLGIVLRPSATTNQATPPPPVPVTPPSSLPDSAPISHSVSPTTIAPDVSTPSIAVAAAAPALQLAWPVVLSVVWLLGAVLTLLPWILSLIGLRRLTRQTTVVTDDALLSVAHAVQNALGIRREVQIRQATEDGLAPVPLGWGWLRPTVLLPHGAGTWSDDRLRAVLLHEMAHVQRGDWGMQIPARFTCAVYWFRPLVWLAARQLRAEAERACDDLVLTAGNMPAADYAQHLLDVARGAWKGQGLGAGAVAMAHSPKIESRLRAVLAPGLPRRPLNRRTAAVLLAFALLAALPLAALRPVARARGAFWTASGPLVERRIARGILTFVYLKDVVSDKHPNSPITMNVSRDSSAHEVYTFFDRRTGRGFRDGAALRADFLKLLAVWDDKKRPGATPYRIPAALAGDVPSRVVFFTANQQKQVQGLAQEAEAWQSLIHNSPVIVTDSDIMTTTAKMNNQIPPYPTLEMLFTSDGSKKMQTFTTVHRDEIMGIILDGRVLSAPIIRGTISNECEMSGGFRDLAETKALSKRLNAPVPTVSAADQLRLHPGFTLRYAATITDLRPRQARMDEYHQMRDGYQRLLKQNPHYQPVPEEALKPFSYFESHNPRVRHVILTISSGNGYLLWQRQVAGDTYTLVYNGRNTQSYGNGHVGASRPGLELLGMYECPLPAVGLPYLPLLQQATLLGASRERQNWQAECTLNRFENDSEMALVQATDTGATWKITDIDSPAQRSQYTQHQQFQGLWIASQMRVTQYGAGSVPAVSPQFKSFPEFMAFVDAQRTPTDTCDYQLISASETPVDLATLVTSHR